MVMAYWLPLLRKIVAALLVLLTPAAPGNTRTRPPSPTPIIAPTTTRVPNMRLVWADEFNYTGYPNATQWEPRVNDQWTNGLQNYTTDSRNAYVVNGILNITAIKEASGDRSYSSARFRSIQRFQFGYFEARILLPQGVGTAPAFWMIGDDAHILWPSCGEIDVLEAPAIAGQTRQVHSGTHNPNGDGTQDVPVGVKPVNSLAGWHTYAVMWLPGGLEWFMDGISLGTVTRADVEAAGGRWVYDTQPEAISLNLGIGGWAGTPGDWQEANMMVDYVRIWQ